MGFRPEPTIYNLSFSGTNLDGLHVRIGCCTLREYDHMTAYQPGEGSTQKELDQHNKEVYELFFRYLKSWDLENPSDGKPTEKSFDGLKEHEPGLIRQIIAAWQMAMVTVQAPLQKQSPNGDSSLEQSLGLASSLESPES